MSRMTWKKPNGEWGVTGVDLSTLPPALYGMAHKLLDFEELCESPDALETHMYQISDLKADLARVTAERDAAVADLHSMHTLCTDMGGCCPECGNQIDELLDAACTFCKGTGVSCWKNDLGNGNRCAAFEWRGPRKEE